jgi:phosphate-selective porin OprO/OprP
MSFIKRLLLTSAASSSVAGVPGARAADLAARKQRGGNPSAARLSLVSGNTKGEKPMKLLDKNKALAAVAVVAFAAHPGTARAEDVAAEIQLLKEQVKQLEPLKDRLKQLEAEVAKQKRERKEAQSRVQSVKGNAGEAREHGEPQNQFANVAVPPEMPYYRISTPMPVFVSLERGLTVLSTDGDFGFHVGGRLMLDGGISSQPAPAFSGTKALPAVAASGFSNQVGIRYARLQVLGSAYRIWDYKFQYDFAGAPNGLVIGGLRDAYLTLRFPDPFSFQVGNFFEPFSLERTQSSNFRDFVERALPSDLLAPNRHIGVAATVGGLAPGIGVPNWHLRAGVFSTSLEDGNPSAVGAPAAGSSSLLNPVPGGHQYWDAAARFTYAPILTPDDLLNIGGSVRYQNPNDATAANDDRVLQPGSTLKTEGNILGENLLGTQPLTCAASAATQLIGENCVKDVVNYGAELVVAHGPFSVQAEYLGMHYDRSASLIEVLHAPGGTSVNFSGYYAYATWYLTGESRADQFRTYPNRYLSPEEFYVPSTFGQIKILRPFSVGGPGAWEVAARLSEINLNSGGFLFAQPAGVPSNIQGGRETDFTLGLNWYPDPGIRFMANWVDVLQLAAPWNRPNINGLHPQIFEMRAQLNF